MVHGLIVRNGLGSWTSIANILWRGLNPGEAALSTMPPYLVVYMWTRVA